MCVLRVQPIRIRRCLAKNVCDAQTIAHQKVIVRRRVIVCVLLGMNQQLPRYMPARNVMSDFTKLTVATTTAHHALLVITSRNSVRINAQAVRKTRMQTLRVQLSALHVWITVLVQQLPNPQQIVGARQDIFSPASSVCSVLFILTKQQRML